MLERKNSDESSSTKVILKNVDQATVELKDTKGDTLVKGKISISSFRILGPEDEQKILDSINKLTNETIDSSQVYEYACQFDRNRESKRITDIFKSALHKHNDLWSKAGIVNIDQGISEDQFPKKKVCIQAKYENDLITSIIISYKGLCWAALDFDIDKLEKTAAIIKKNKLTYVNNFMEIADELGSLSDFFNSAGFVKDLNKLLKKWPMMRATVTPVIGKSYCDVNFIDTTEMLKYEMHIHNCTYQLLRQTLSSETNALPQVTFKDQAALLSEEQSGENTSDKVLSFKPG